MIKLNFKLLPTCSNNDLGFWRNINKDRGFLWCEINNDNSYIWYVRPDLFKFNQLNFSTYKKAEEYLNNYGE